MIALSSKNLSFFIILSSILKSKKKRKRDVFLKTPLLLPLTFSSISLHNANIRQNSDENHNEIIIQMKGTING